MVIRAFYCVNTIVIKTLQGFRWGYNGVKAIFLNWEGCSKLHQEYNYVQKVTTQRSVKKFNFCPSAAGALS